MVPYIELADGRTIVAADGADAIEPSADGQTLKARWTRWVTIGSKSGEWAAVGLTSEVVWHITNNSISREETLSATKPVTIRGWRMAVPSSYGKVDTEIVGNKRIDRFSANQGSLSVELDGNSFPVSTSIIATGNGPLGKGVHGAVPLHLVLEARNVTLTSPVKYRLTLTVAKSSNQ